jgi:ABC-type Fe3+/spermidine/putrescine transport system ATPase subunit
VESILELRALSKNYASNRIVDDISVSVRKGEFFSLVGPSGCGKTTTLRLIAGFEQPTSGEVLLDGEPMDGLPPHRRDVCTVFQNYALFPHLTVEQNVAFGLERRPRAHKRQIHEEVADALALVQLSGKETRLPNQISGGERQRVALARSLVLRPKVLLLDEPLSALDAKLRKEMRHELKKLQRAVGIAFLFITHDQEEALSLSDRVAVMNKGKLEQTGTPQELYRQPQSRFVAEFLGEVNWLNGACVRPEAVRVSRGLPAPAAHDAAHSTIGIVESATFLGNCVHLEARLPDGSHCIAELPQQDCDFVVGETVNIWWQAADEFRLSMNI